MTSSSSMSETMRISREHFGHRSGSASHTFLINSRLLGAVCQGGCGPVQRRKG